MDLSDFSVVSTSAMVDSKRRKITKLYSLNTNVDISLPALQRLMDDYLSCLREAEIPVPEVIGSRIQEDKLLYECQFCGDNIVQLGLNASNFNKFEPYIRKMALVVKQAITREIYFDPHPKNFVFDDQKNIFYVDFFPPYSDELKHLRLDAAPENEKKMVSDNYSFFTSKFLAAHFCGDFLNIDRDFEVVFGKIYEIFHDLNVPLPSTSDFFELAKSIRSIEDCRIDLGVYLL